MLTLRKTVRIPSDRRVHFELSVPDAIPPGDADVLLVIAAAGPSRRGNDISRFAGRMAHSQTLARGGAAIQREMRDEW